VTRVLVTGATGFIGRGTLEPLLASGMEVHAVSSRRQAPPPGSGIEWHHSDLLSAEGAGEIVQRVRPTHLLHLAWFAEPGAFWSSVENVRWVEASLRLLRAFAAQDGERAVLAGSCAEYAWEDRTVCSEATTPCRPATLYGACKHGLHVMAEPLAAGAGVSMAWGRIFFVFGPQERTERLGGAVASALVQGVEAACSHGRQRRDFLYSEDLADAFVALLRSPVQGAVNLASGTAIQVRELVLGLARAAGRPELINLGARPTAPGEPAELAADVRRLRDEVGWTPPADLSQRTADCIAWWRRELGVEPDGASAMA
jgi:nucleoside-diphosphate-sugar epimerase